MKAIAAVFVVALCAAGYLFWQDSKSTDGGPGTVDAPSARKGEDPGADLEAANIAKAKTSDGKPADSRGEERAGPPRASRTPVVHTPEPPMTAAQRKEVDAEWRRMCESSIGEEEWLDLSRQHPDSFETMDDPERDPALVLRAAQGVLGSRIGIGDSNAGVSRVHGGLPFAGRALRQLGTAVREGHIKFRMEPIDEGRDGLLKAAPHTQRKLNYKWRIGNRAIHVTVDRISTVSEVLDMFDPDRFQG